MVRRRQVNSRSHDRLLQALSNSRRHDFSFERDAKCTALNDRGEEIQRAVLLGAVRVGGRVEVMERGHPCPHSVRSPLQIKLGVVSRKHRKRHQCLNK